MAFKIYSCDNCDTIVGMDFNPEYINNVMLCPLCGESMDFSDDYAVDNFLDSVDKFDRNRNCSEPNEEETNEDC